MNEVFSFAAPCYITDSVGVDYISMPVSRQRIFTIYRDTDEKFYYGSIGSDKIGPFGSPEQAKIEAHKSVGETEFHLKWMQEVYFASTPFNGQGHTQPRKMCHLPKKADDFVNSLSENVALTQNDVENRAGQTIQFLIDQGCPPAPNDSLERWSWEIVKRSLNEKQINMIIKDIGNDIQNGIKVGIGNSLNNSDPIRKLFEDLGIGDYLSIQYYFNETMCKILDIDWLKKGLLK